MHRTSSLANLTPIPSRVLAAAMVLGPAAAHAQDTTGDVANSGDTAWLMACTVLVFCVALPGIALFHAGRSSARNSISILLQSAAIPAVVSLVWIAAAYTVAFGDVTSGWLGSGNAWMLIELGNVRLGSDVPESAFALFQIALASLAPVLLSGAWAGRARFGWVLLFCALWSLVVYAPIAHWIWGGGWLAQGLGTMDWSGGLVIETSAGVSALVVAIMLGRGHRHDQAPHGNPAMTLLGAILLWAGWMAIAGSSALSAGDNAAAAAISVHAAAVAASLVWIGLEKLAGRLPSATGFAMGAVCGLATIVPAAGYVSPGAAALIGAIGALTGRCALWLVRTRLRIDDRLDVFALIGAGSIVGSMLVAVFASPSLGGVGFAEGMGVVAQLTAQAVALVVVAVWSIVATVIMALMASMVLPMRVSEQAEQMGLDAASHGARPSSPD